MLLGLGACGPSDEAPAEARWRMVFEQLDGAVISVHGTSASDVWAVGGDPGTGPLVLHYDGARWTRKQSGASADLWWVHALAPDDVFFGGSKGTILRFDGSSFESLPTPSDATVFGIWGTSSSDLWAVGGDPLLVGKAFVWRFDGQTWAPAAGMVDVPVSSYFKVWGKSATDVRIVGNDGVIVHFDGDAFTAADSPTTRRLLTLHASPDAPWVAVGGLGVAVVLEDAGAGWQDVTPEEPLKAIIGVRVQGNVGYAAGNGGTVLERTVTGWKRQSLGFDVFQDFHSVWIDETAGVWVAGGDLATSPLVNGVLIHRGEKPPSRQLD